MVRVKRSKARAGDEPQDIIVSATALTKAPEIAGGAQTDLPRRETIAVAAYYLAQRRGFEPGHELEDWCAAEAQFDKVKSAR